MQAVTGANSGIGRETAGFSEPRRARADVVPQ